MINASARSVAVQEARELLAQRPVYLDAETTGTGPNATIVEIAVIDHDGTMLVDSLVKPLGRIPPDAMRIHGITNKMVAEAPGWDEVWPQVEAALTGRVVGIYNADFDLRMMEQTHQAHWMNWRLPEGSRFFCIMKLYARFYGQRHPRYGSYKWQSLDAAGRQCNLPLPNAHRAKDDTLLTRAVLEYMAR